MANTLKFGNGEWYGKKDTILAYNDENSNYKPLPFDFARASKATVVNKDGLIETVGSGEPRIDYKDDSKGALLLEPSRSNSLLQSNQFDTTWTLSSSIALTSGQSGVGGSTDAWLLKKTDAASRYINQTITLSSSTYSYSVFAKKESGNWLYVRLADSGGSLASTSYFDLENGVVGSTSADSLSIHSYNNGWYRCEVKFTHSIGNVRMYPAVGDGSPSGGSGGEGIYIQNAQLEQGNYPTSYIPTSGSAVTRLADDIDTDFGTILPLNGEVSVYMEMLGQPSDVINTTGKVVSVNFDETTNSSSYVALNFNGTNWRARVQGATGNNFVSFEVDQTETIKALFVLRPTSYALYANGSLIGSETRTYGGTAPNMNEISKVIYLMQTDDFGITKNKDLRVYNTALSNAEAIALTQV
jgi:hypothetical protein